MDDEAKRKILARRAKFVAAAVVGLVACEPAPQQPPVVCLSIALPPPEDGGPEPTIVDAGASVDASAVAPVDAEAPPVPCLSPLPPPQVCLSPLPPPPADAAPPPRVCLSKMPSPPPPVIPPPPPKPCLDVDGP